MARVRNRRNTYAPRGAKNISYEGEQYRGGKVAGRKNLIKNSDGTITNQHGVVFSQEDKKALERAVNASNYQRKAKLDKWEKARIENAQHFAWGKEPEFIITRQSKSLQRFHSREDFEAYLQKQADIKSGAYLDYRTSIYKDNYCTALETVFGDDAADIQNVIQQMDNARFRYLVEAEKLPDIHYIYSAEKRAAKLSELRALFNMLNTEDYIEPY